MFATEHILERLFSNFLASILRIALHKRKVKKAVLVLHWSILKSLVCGLCVDSPLLKETMHKISRLRAAKEKMNGNV